MSLSSLTAERGGRIVEVWPLLVCLLVRLGASFWSSVRGPVCHLPTASPDPENQGQERSGKEGERAQKRRGEVDK